MIGKKPDRFVDEVVSTLTLNWPQDEPFLDRERFFPLSNDPRTFQFELFVRLIQPFFC